MQDEMISLPIRAAPYKHQCRAAAFALDRLDQGGGAALLMEMGTGKTLTSYITDIRLGVAARALVDSTQNIWDGGATGNWSDPANWSLGMVPQAGQSATLPSGCTVTLAESTPRLKEVVVAVGATLVASNWTTCVSADRVSVAGTVTATGPFTNELHKSRVWISCGDLEVAASGKIDVAGKGWKGGVNGVYALSYTALHTWGLADIRPTIHTGSAARTTIRSPRWSLVQADTA